MNKFWSTSAITGVGLFLETCAFYLLFGFISQVAHLPVAGLSFWLVLLALVWAYLLSFYIQTLQFTGNVRGVTGLAISVVSMLILASLNWGRGMIPVSEIINGDAGTGAGVFLTLAFLVTLWWRGSTLAQDDMTLDTVRGSFRWGLVVVFAAVLIDSLGAVEIVNGFLILGFFGAGMVGLSLARFSWEAGESQSMSINWWVPIGVATSAVLALGLLISAVGLGGMDDVTRLLLRTVDTIGFWVLKPILLGFGLLVGLLIGLANWIAGFFGGGDLSTLVEAQEQILRFQENMREQAGEGGFPGALVAALKWAGFLIATALSGWLLYRLFGFRRMWRREKDVEETRESLFSWRRANQDLSLLLSDWLNNLTNVAQRKKGTAADPRNPREYYHGLLAVAAGLNLPRREWQTPKEHQSTLRGVLPVEPVAHIIDCFQSDHYGHVAAGEVELDRLKQDWEVINEFLGKREQ